MFVSLDRLKPIDVQQPTQKPRQPSEDEHFQKNQEVSQINYVQPVEGHHSLKPYHSEFKLEDRVVVHDKNGIGVHGSVRWIENVKYGGDVLVAIGIETVSLMNLLNLLCMTVHLYIYINFWFGLHICT